MRLDNVGDSSMRFLHVVIGVILLLLDLAAGAFALYGLSPAGRGRWEIALLIARQEHWLVFMAGVTLILLVVLYVLTFTRSRKNAQTIYYAGENGLVTINMRAVRDFIQRIAGEFSEIISLQPNLDFRGGTLFIELDVRVASGVQIPELCQLVQERVADSIREQLGLNDIKYVRINVRELVQRPNPSANDPDSTIA